MLFRIPLPKVVTVQSTTFPNRYHTNLLEQVLPASARNASPINPVLGSPSIASPLPSLTPPMTIPLRVGSRTETVQLPTTSYHSNALEKFTAEQRLRASRPSNDLSKKTKGDSVIAIHFPIESFIRIKLNYNYFSREQETGSMSPLSEIIL